MEKSEEELIKSITDYKKKEINMRTFIAELGWCDGVSKKSEIKDIYKYVRVRWDSVVPTPNGYWREV